MGIPFLISVSVFCILCLGLSASSSKLRIEQNGYRDMLVSLPSDVVVKEKSRVVSSLKDLFRQSSLTLSQATKGRSHFHSITFLVPRSWGEMDSWLPTRDNGTTFDDAGASSERQKADVTVKTGNTHPYTLHQGGCGRRSMRIYLPVDFVLSDDQKQKNVEFVRLWSEFRYGVFPEGGFNDDPKYPYLYKEPGEPSNKTTGCVNELLGQSQDLGTGSETSPKSSLMDQHLPSTAIHFCENYLNLGPRHNPNSPSKHNLLCHEEGTWFTVLRSPDFKNGRNAAPKSPLNTEVTFRYARELDAPRMLVALDVSSRMNMKQRYPLTKNAFSQFVTTHLPANSELSVLLFGGNSAPTMVTSNIQLVDEQTRSSYLESLPLPDEPLSDENSCINCVLDHIIELVANESSASAPTVILVTTNYYLNQNKFDVILDRLQKTEIVLTVMAFPDEYLDLISQVSLYDLCLKTGGRFISLEGDVLSNLYNGFHQAVSGPRSSELVYQKYLTTLDEENIEETFIVDKSISDILQVAISGPSFGATSILEYDKTVLVLPSGKTIHPKKHELVPSLNFFLHNPEEGVYVLKTRRKKRAISPVLVSVYGTQSSVEDSISVKVWVEIPKSKISPPPVQIFAEVRKGPYPIKNGSVTAFVQHPGGFVESLSLFDDGLGSVDITHGDGIYTHFFTNFTTIGFYNVLADVIGDYSTILKGPPVDCCGSSFPWSEEVSAGAFQRATGPLSFRVTTVPSEDQYPPARVTDLRIAKAYDQVVALQWSAVGNDLDTGDALAYELKLFRDRSLIQSRFADPGLELYSETIEVTSPAAYGTNLYHVTKIPPTLEKGVYYFGMRALDDAGNAGEPSNAVAVKIGIKDKPAIDCSDEPTAEKIGGGASSHNPFVFIIICIVSLAFL